MNVLGYGKGKLVTEGVKISNQLALLQGGYPGASQVGPAYSGFLKVEECGRKESEQL